MYYMCILRKCLVLIIYKYFDLYTIGQNYDQPKQCAHINMCIHIFTMVLYILVISNTSIVDTLYYILQHTHYIVCTLYTILYYILHEQHLWQGNSPSCRCRRAKLILTLLLYTHTYTRYTCI